MSEKEPTELAPEGTFPTPDQFIALWNSLDLDNRRELAMMILTGWQTASACLMEDHHGQLNHYRRICRNDGH